MLHLSFRDFLLGYHCDRFEFYAFSTEMKIAFSKEMVLTLADDCV